MNFRDIFKQNNKNIKKIIKSITNEENEDLEQEVYIRVLKNSDRYKEKGNFKAWINTITRNISIDYLKSARKKHETLAIEEEYFCTVKDKGSTPELRLIKNEQEERILNEINKLSPKLKDVIIYTEFYNLSYEECAKKLKCPLGTIKSRVFNAKRQLAEKLNDLL